MQGSRRKADWPILVAVVASLVLVTLGLYVGGYFWLADTRTVMTNVMRFYSERWLTHVFRPAGQIEEWLTGNGVHLFCKDDIHG
jgi:hypothetical protein